MNAIRSPSVDTRIHWKRKYLEGAKQAYMETGGSYPLSKSEERMADFDTNIDAICKITFSIGGYLSYVVELSDELKAYTKSWNEEAVLLSYGDSQRVFTKGTFMAALKDLHIGEWRKRYSTKRFGYTVRDGTQWNIGTSDTDAFVSYSDAQCVLALIMGAVRADRFCEGALLYFFKSGCILRWLERLQSIE